MSVAAVILAAGRSSRMGANKMLADIGGEKLIRRTANAVHGSRARPIIVVTGHEPGKVAEALAGLEVTFAGNPRYAEGISTSLVAGLGAVPESASGVLVCLGDMPLIGAAVADALIGRFEDEPTAGAVVPAHAGEWGNPVLISRKLFPDLEKLSGDGGARKLLQGRPDVVVLELADQAVLIDADTPEELERMRAALRPREG